MSSAIRNSLSKMPLGWCPTSVIAPSPVLPFLAPSLITARQASGISLGQRTKQKAEKLKKRRKQRTTYRRDDLKKADTFSLLDAIRYLKAFEAGHNPSTAKYEMHVSFRTFKNSPVVRGQLRVPHAVKAAQRIAVICPAGSDVAAEARAEGAALVGEDDLLAEIKAGKIDFERLLLHPDSEAKLRQAAVGRLLGPKGLMPNHKTGTIVRDVAAAIRGMVGGTEFREMQGVVHMAIGKLSFTPDMLSKNIQVVMQRLKSEAARINETIQKEVHEVGNINAEQVLSSTNGPGLTLNGDFSSATSLPPSQLSVN